MSGRWPRWLPRAASTWTCPLWPHGGGSPRQRCWGARGCLHAGSAAVACHGASGRRPWTREDTRTRAASDILVPMDVLTLQPPWAPPGAPRPDSENRCPGCVVGELGTTGQVQPGEQKGQCVLTACRDAVHGPCRSPAGRAAIVALSSRRALPLFSRSVSGHCHRPEDAVHLPAVPLYLSRPREPWRPLMDSVSVDSPVRTFPINGSRVMVSSERTKCPSGFSAREQQDVVLGSFSLSSLLLTTRLSSRFPWSVMVY